jgi:hypothetical protein
VAFGNFTARAFSYESTIFVAWQEEGQRTLCRLNKREEEEAAEAIRSGDCETVRRICKSAMRVQLALNGPEADKWKSVGAIEWKPETEGADESEIAIEWQPEPEDVSEGRMELSGWRAELERSDGVSESELDAQESRPEEVDFKADLRGLRTSSWSGPRIRSFRRHRQRRRSRKSFSA